MRVLVTGSSGLIGRELVAELGRQGHDTTRLVRRPAAGAAEASWDPSVGTIDAAKVEGHDAAVHLAGAGIGDHRWSDEHKRAVLDSRVQGTGLLARTLAGLDQPPTVLISGSAVGYYGYESDQPMTETSPKGNGFLADVVAAWEEAAAPAQEAGIRTVKVRSGVVLTAKGGALKKQLLPFKLGFGGRLGDGKQWLSWISLDDEVAAIIHLLTSETSEGPVNVTSPQPVTNKEFTATLARVLHRLALVPVPTPALHALFGKEMTKEMLLGGQRVLPEALDASGYTFAHPSLEEALRHTLRH
ncbi:MAG TPA: TIGR01777 family oxidoreductase [Acidimicrobiales bacterium]|nr:TIGR01777 family oxidoreductase [Acidimicrobiales bacterium]